MKRCQVCLLLTAVITLLLVACSDEGEFAATAMPNQLAEPTQTTQTEPLRELATIEDPADLPLPDRAGPQTQTSGTVPHVQIDVELVEAVNAELFRRAYMLPGVEERPTIVSLPGAQGMWLNEEVEIAVPTAIVAGREFAHIHPDGSLHAPLPFERALEVADTGWGERHPWADERPGWEGFVMLYTPQSLDELEVTFQLIVESYNHVTGQSLLAADYK